MNQRLDYIKELGISLSQEQLIQLEQFLNLVWDKKDSLNLTSVKDKQEIWDRHILDGLTAVPLIKSEGVTLADCGAGAGYIGITLKIALPNVKVALIESLEKRCAFMNWVILKLGLKDIEVINARVGEGGLNRKFDFVTQRAMGKIEDVLPLCTGILEEGGRFIAYQALENNCDAKTMCACNTEEDKTVKYTLPGEDKERKLVVFKWT